VPGPIQARRAARRLRLVAQAAPYRGQPKLSRPPPERNRRLVIHAIVSTLVIHAAVVAAGLYGRSPQGPAARRLVEISVMEHEAAKPKPPPPPPPPKLPPPKAPVMPKVEEKAPPPPNEAPPKDAKVDAPVMVGLTKSSTTEAGDFAAPVGNTLYGAAPQVAPSPDDVHAYKAPRYVPPGQVTHLPERLAEVRPRYPEEALRLELEAEVVLLLRVDATGQVTSVKVVRGAGHGFDQAAIEAARQLRFKPGSVGGEAVATDVSYTYTFRLDS